MDYRTRQEYERARREREQAAEAQQRAEEQQRAEWARSNEQARAEREARAAEAEAQRRAHAEAQLELSLAERKAFEQRAWLAQHPERSAADFDQLAWPLMRANVLGEQAAEARARIKAQLRASGQY